MGKVYPFLCALGSKEGFSLEKFSEQPNECKIFRKISGDNGRDTFKLKIKKTKIKNRMQEKTKEELLKSLFSSFVTGVRSFKSTKAREWLKKKGLSYEDLSIGFSSGQFHHRKPDDFRNDYLRIGVLKESKASVREKHLTAYTCFGNFAIVFPLKNQVGQIVNLYAVRIKTATEKTEYLNEEGIYPSYPNSLTQRLIITNDVMSTATILQSKIMENRDSVIALRDGEFQRQHFEAISQLENLQEIIFIK